jgi:hypothetical protein
MCRGVSPNSAHARFGVRALLQQPAHAGGALRGVGSPTQDVTERRNAARDSVQVDAKAVQQFQGAEIAGSGSDMHRDTVGRIRSAFEQDLREREVIDCAQRIEEGHVTHRPFTERSLAFPSCPIVPERPRSKGFAPPRQTTGARLTAPGRS